MLRAEWTATAGRAPRPAEDVALQQGAIDEEILIDVARDLGLDRTPAVRTRLARLMQFAATDPGEEAGALERAARALALDRDDVVVRRHLGILMRLALSRVPDDDFPDDAALQSYLDEHADRFREPARWQLTQVFVSDPDARADADRLRSTLVGVDVDAPAVARAGVPFIHGRDLAGSAVELDRWFGGGFATQLEQAPVGQWVGPLRSAYGWHVLWVRDYAPARMPSLASVRGQVVQAWLHERGQIRGAERMAALRSRYDAPAASR